MKWRDTTNNVDRLLVNAGINALHVKDLSPAESWAGPISGAVQTIRDYANFQQAIWWMGASASGVPQRYSYDGVTLDIDPFRERLSSISIAPWKNRLWLANIFEFITNQIGAGNAYGNSGSWTFTNINVNQVTVGSTVLTTWTPTSQTSAKAEVKTAFAVPASSEDTFVLFHSDLLGLATVLRMPLTLEVFTSQAAARVTPAVVGDIRVPTVANGFRYRAITAGLTGVGEPAWNTVIGSVTNDNVAQWENLGVDAWISTEIEVDNSRDNRGQWQTEWALARFAPMPSSMIVGIRIKFGTTARAVWDIQPIGVGFKDGKADGAIGKQNYGQQLTVGRFFLDFFNKESVDSGFVNYPNRVIACEAGLPREWRADMYWDMVEGEGGIVAARPLQDSMVLYKRNAINVYDVVEGTAAARLPMRYARTFFGVGLLHAKAQASFEGRHYFVGEQQVYVFDGTNAPQALADDSMREAIFDHGTNWQDTAALLQVDEGNRELRLHTQSGKLWIYGIDTKVWTSQNITKDGAAGVSTIGDLIYFRNKMYAVATTNGLVREDVTATKDEVYTAGVVTSFDVTAEVWLHPFESIPRSDVLIEGIEIHHDITGDQTGTTLEADVSFDRGVTFPDYLKVTVPITTDDQPIYIPLWQSGANLTVRLRHIGKSGPTYFKVFWAGAYVQDLGEETNDSIPTVVSAAL